jgi:hypothetical protein
MHIQISGVQKNNGWTRSFALVKNIQFPSTTNPLSDESCCPQEIKEPTCSKIVNKYFMILALAK